MAIATNIGDLITSSLEIGGGRPMLTGTATSVRRIAVLYQQGASAEEIARRLSHLSLAQVYAALAYYHANRDEIEADLLSEDLTYWQLASSFGNGA
ncbi:MAG: DUF433 domain-containing protein [Cyanobacteria bacterium RI_101]|nr:DUF433 domain-containing protein [Cyanobacteria bacterium RI_101]